MRSGIRFPIFAVVSALVVLLVASSAAQQITFKDFSSVNNLTLNGSTHQATWQSQKVLRLTDGSMIPNAKPEAGTAYFNIQQPLTNGFTTWFAFQIHNPTVCCMPGDGVAFIIQNSSATDSSYGATGQGLTALGAGGNPSYPNQGGAMGYAGINNNLAVEFDIHQDPWDPNASHVAVQSCGLNTNTPVHMAGDYTIGLHSNVPDCLLSGAIQSVPAMGGTCSGGRCTDGAVHQVVIQYTPPVGHQPMGTLTIWLDPMFVPGTHFPAPGATPTITTAYNVDALSLNNGSAWVGFTASQPRVATAQDILAWEFTLHGPVQVQQVIPPGGTPATYSFGEHEMVVTYPPGFTNPAGILMTVLATPTDRNTFFQQRLLGTQFANESCIVYLGTGGNNCIVYSVTCQDPMTMQNVPCPSEPEPTIDIDSSFDTSDPVSPTNADFLEAEPIGSNNWMSIFTSFTDDPIDGTMSGKGKGFSDIVATFVRNKP
jgi:Legume lectin domain